MKIPKEIWVVVAIVAFLLAYLIDRLAGPVAITVGNPVAFLRSSVLLHRYPFTATAILIRTFAIFVSVMLLLSFIPRKYFLKIILILFAGTLAEFFAIQQLATGFHATSIQWTLSIAYGALSLSLGIVWLFLMGIWAGFNKQEDKKQETTHEEEKSSILDQPPKQ